MTRYILYFLKANKEQRYEIISDNFIIRIITGDLKKLFPTCAKRAHDVYIDKEFNTREYQTIINECIKPLASLNGGEGLIFI